MITQGSGGGSVSDGSQRSIELTGNTTGPTFLDPAVAVAREQQQQQQQLSPQPRIHTTNNIKFSIPINTHTSANTLATGSPATAPVSAPGTPQTRFVIVKSSRTGTPAASHAPSPTPQMAFPDRPKSRQSSTPQQFPPSPGLSPLVPTQSASLVSTALQQVQGALAAAQAEHPRSSVSEATNELLQVNESRPLEKSSPALLAEAERFAIKLTSSLADLPEHDNTEVPPMELPSSHPAAFVRPPTPPNATRRGSHSKRNSRSMSLSARDPPLSGSKDTLSPFGSGRDQFPGPSAHPPPSATRTSGGFQMAFGESFDGAGNEFSSALRAALAEAGASAGASAHNSWKNKKGDGHDDASPAQVSSPQLPSSTLATPTEETTERELRKQAIRQKNAMHMRIRNASVGGNMLTGSRQPSVNRAAIAAAANAAVVKEEKSGGNANGHNRSPSGSPGGAHMPRSLTFQGPKSPSAGFKFPTASELLSPIESPRVGEEKSVSPPISPSKVGELPTAVIIHPDTTSHPPASNDLPPPPSPQAQPMQRTRSSILKPTAPITDFLPPSPQQTGARRQLSGILRSPSKTGTTALLPDKDPMPQTGPSLMRVNTASRVGFVVPEGTADTEAVTSESEDETTEAKGKGKDKEKENTTAAPSHAPKRKASQITSTSMGIPSLHVSKSSPKAEPQRARKEIFVQNGDQLMLTSVSTTAGGYQHSHQAANVMVLSVSSIFTRLRLYTDLCFYLAMFGILLTVVNKELHFAYPHDDGVQIAITVVRAITSFSTIALIYCLYEYYRADFQFLQLNRVYLLRSATWNSQLIWQFAFEVLICLIHEPPYLNHDVDLSVDDAVTIYALKGFNKTEVAPVIVRNPWSLLIALRFYFFLRLILSRYYTGGTKILGLWFNFSFNVPFATRNMLYSHPLLSLVPVVAMLIGSCSYALYVFEREDPDRHFTFGTALWVVMITISAVGYGDITPSSSGGRAICILSAFIGIMVTAVLVAAVHQKLTLLPYEGRMVEFLERDSNSTTLKYFASRCISRAWRYYRFRGKAIQMVRAKSFGAMARTNLLRYKTVMLQGIFDFQTARKQIQAYDRRYHSEQLFRSMLEGLYDKLESMTLDFNVLEDELDLSYEEQRKLGARQMEILEELKKTGPHVPGANIASAVSGETSTVSQLPPEHGRLSLLRTSSMPGASPPTPKGEGNQFIPVLTRPSSITPADTTGRNSALELDTDITAHHGRHQSMRNSATRFSTNDEPSVSTVHTPPGPTVVIPENTAGPLSLGAATAPAASSVTFEAALDSRRGVNQLNSKRASTLGGLDLAAAAAAATGKHRRHGSNESGPNGAITVAQANQGGPRGSVRARSSQDLLTGVVVESPSAIDAPLSARLNRRASIRNDASTVTTDLLNVVAALSPTNNPELAPAPAGKIRFGEADFAAHRAVNANPRANRQTILLQRGKSVIDPRGGALPSSPGGVAVPSGTSPDGRADGGSVYRPHFRRPSSMELAMLQPGVPAGPSTAGTTMPATHPSLTHALSVQHDERGNSPIGRPSVARTASGGNALRAAANARAIAGGGTHGVTPQVYQSTQHITSDQFDRMMLLLANVSERLAGVELAMQQPSNATKSPRKTVNRDAPHTPEPNPIRRLEQPTISSGHHHSHSFVTAPPPATSPTPTSTTIQPNIPETPTPKTQTTTN